MVAVRDPDRPPLGVRLVELRQAQRIKQLAVAIDAHMSRSTYARIESGDTVPTQAQLRAIAAALRVDVADLRQA